MWVTDKWSQNGSVGPVLSSKMRWIAALARCSHSLKTPDSPLFFGAGRGMIIFNSDYPMGLPLWARG